jgi:hypothetical protein
MPSDATTVSAYLASLPADRRATVAAVREVIRANLDPAYEEGMQYGMIGYYVPHRVYPPGYHANPKQPLPFAALASQKNHLSLYLMGVYTGSDDGAGESPVARWFREAWAKTGKTLDMGKACVRFKRIEDLALEVIGEAIRRIPAKTYIAQYEAVLGAKTKSTAKKTTTSAKKKSTAKTTTTRAKKKSRATP